MEKCSFSNKILNNGETVNVLTWFTPDSIVLLIEDFCANYGIEVNNRWVIDIFVRAFKDLCNNGYSDTMIKRIMEEKYSTSQSVLDWISRVETPYGPMGDNIAKWKKNPPDLQNILREEIYSLIDEIYLEVHAFLQKEKVCNITYVA